jgi:tRNA G46 methylase TrmB
MLPILPSFHFHRSTLLWRAAPMRAVAATRVARAVARRAAGFRARPVRWRATHATAPCAGQVVPEQSPVVVSDPSSAIAKPRMRGKRLDRPWHLTYLRNQGTCTPAQKLALRDLWGVYGVDVTTYQGSLPPPKLSFDDLFPAHAKNAPVALEIGFGLGDNLVQMARNQPGTRIIGAEVHKPGVGSALMKIKQGKLRNVRLVKMDALWLLRDFIPDDSLQHVCVYFPDPWTEDTKHRRIVNPFLIALLERKMKRSPDEEGGRARLHGTCWYCVSQIQARCLRTLFDVQESLKGNTTYITSALFYRSW